MTDLQVTILKEDPHFFHVRVQKRDNEMWLLTIVYTSLQENERGDTWVNLLDISGTIHEPLLVIGDLNDISSSDEKKGGDSS